MTLPTAAAPQIIAQPNPKGGLPLVCSYWHNPNHGRFQDPWSYQLTNGDTFSHVSEAGCRVMIRDHFIKIGAIIIPEDNSHLDDFNAARWEEIEARWKGFADDGPRVGDFLRMADGTMTRICKRYARHAQTIAETAGSYHMTAAGWASYSGGLDEALPIDRMRPTDETKRGAFWFWRDGMAGGGRGLQAWTDCEVYQLA